MALFSLLLCCSVLTGVSGTRWHGFGPEKASSLLSASKRVSSSSCFKARNENLARGEDSNNDIVTTQKYRPSLKTTSWNGTVVTYRLKNYPICSDMSEAKIKSEVDRAAAAWSAVPLANVVLQNVEELEMDGATHMTEDIQIRFSPCNHPLDRSEDFLGSDHNFGAECSRAYAHTIMINGEPHDIHLNTLMSWTDKELVSSPPAAGELEHPYFYTIILHELGHALGILHLTQSESVMHSDFGGSRKYQELALTQIDMAELKKQYPIWSMKCMDYNSFCWKASPTDCSLSKYKKDCPRTCGVCVVCDGSVEDTYMKCSPSLCSIERYRTYCMATCNICAEACRILPPFLRARQKLPLIPGESTVVSCREGFTLTGSSEVTCGNAAFLDLPTCTPKECEVLPGVFLRTKASLPVKSGETITVRCRNGYELEGSSEVKCQYGEFLDPPSCKKKCKDKISNCSLKIIKNPISCQKKNFQKKCKLTCGLCN